MAQIKDPVENQHAIETSLESFAKDLGTESGLAKQLTSEEAYAADLLSSLKEAEEDAEADQVDGTFSEENVAVDDSGDLSSGDHSEPVVKKKSRKMGRPRLPKISVDDPIWQDAKKKYEEAQATIKSMGLKIISGSKVAPRKGASVSSEAEKEATEIWKEARNPHDNVKRRLETPSSPAKRAKKSPDACELEAVKKARAAAISIGIKFIGLSVDETNPLSADQKAALEACRKVQGGYLSIHYPLKDSSPDLLQPAKKSLKRHRYAEAPISEAASSSSSSFSASSSSSSPSASSSSSSSSASSSPSSSPILLSKAERVLLDDAEREKAQALKNLQEARFNLESKDFKTHGGSYKRINGKKEEEKLTQEEQELMAIWKKARSIYQGSLTKLKDIQEDQASFSKLP